MAPRDGSGVYSKPAGTTAIPNTTITSAPYNALQDDMADALTESLPRTGVAPMLADLPMGGKKITGLDDGTDPGDAVNRGQIDGKLNVDASNATARTKWRLRAIGEIVYVDTSKPGVEIPPDDAGFIELSAGLDGSGGYNEGKLTSETIIGSGATLVATAVIDDVDSPMDGETINLINTEERVRYAGERAKSGDVFNDQMQQITGSITRGATGVFFGRGDPVGSGALDVVQGDSSNLQTTGSAYATFDINLDSAESPNARTGDRTRAKGQFLVAFLKYKDVA